MPHYGVMLTCCQLVTFTNPVSILNIWKKRPFHRSCCSFSCSLLTYHRLTGVNLLIGTENGLMLLDRSGQGKVYQLISRRRFQQMEVLEGQNILVTVSGKKNRVRVYYLSWLKSKILRTEGVGGDQVRPITFLSIIYSCILCVFLLACFLFHGSIIS